METLSFEANRSKYALYFLGALAFTVGGVWMISEGHWFWGWFNALFFGLCTATFVWQMRGGGPRLVIDDSGLYDRTLGVGTIAWSDIEDAYVARTNNLPFLCLVLRDPSVYTRKLNPVKRALSRTNGAFGFTALALNLHGLRGVDPEEIEALVRSEASARRAV